LQVLTQGERIEFLGCPVDRLSIPQALEWIRTAATDGRSRQIVVVNANKLYLMTQNERLRRIVVKADLIIPEWAVVWGVQQLGLPPLSHVGGLTLALAFFPFAAENGLRPYFLGAKPKVINALVEKLRSDYPALKIAGSHDGYLSDPEIEQAVVTDIQRTKPDVLFVAMGSPKQEYWINDHRDTLGVPVSIGVGGSFDVLSGFKKDAPSWTRGHGLEWIYRLLQAPRVYWKRYLITNSWFVCQVMKARWTGVKSHRPD
jgi:N-acetylglucosaminyldiphosphoundecaprenol N-acetyl-beta-D-mannosaminyltransferase